ncbi:MAG: STAS domain-containing protein [Gemmatimonadales bacterium]|nr:STAS domain-containing protein [Gemmatimonadales bacterium]
MQATHLPAREITAPEHLGLESRAAFRQAAIALLDSLPDGSRLAIDLAATRHVDSAGLGVLMLVQRKAAERRQSVALLHANDELRFLLNITKLSELFALQ